jgi:peptidoglycan hydrolase-like protein with peptidoglycan-binding domain
VSRRRRLVAAALGLAAAGGIAVGATRLVAPAASAADPSASPAATAATARSTATVERRTLTVTEELEGTLGFDGEEQVVNQATGTLTRLPPPGHVIRRGGSLYELDGHHRPVLFIGARPAWRPLGLDSPNGADIQQLEENLAALGYLEAGQVDRNWDADTTDAVEAWQGEAGFEVDGTIELGDIVFLPTELRVVSTSASLGARLGPGQPVLTGSTTARVVTVELETDRTDLVAEGDAVEIVLPDGWKTTGTVAEVGRVAVPQQTQTGEAGTPTVTVTIALDDPEASAAWDAAPVEVEVVRDSREDVLTVPVNALVALLEGGYAVEVVEDDGSTRYEAVELGLFQDGRVEVRADDLEDGDLVVVPS